MGRSHMGDTTHNAGKLLLIKYYADGVKHIRLFFVFFIEEKNLELVKNVI